jgi:uncharacterized membrane protein YfcA
VDFVSPGFIAVTVGIAMAAGLFGSLLGLGGGLFVVPMLTGLLGVRTEQAIGASVVAVIATSCVAGSTYLRKGMVNVPVGIRLELATVCGAICGALSLTYANPRLLNAIFGLVLLYTGGYMFISVRAADPVRAPQGPPSRFDFTFFAPVRRTIVRYRVRHLPAGIAASLVGGFVSGILGIGGGLFNVPAMYMFMGVPLKVATATSAFIIGVTGTAGAFIQYAHGLVDPALALPVVVGVMCGALVGPYLARRIPGRRLQEAFVLVVAVFAAEMLWRAANGAR